jgi:hypothetical protein
MVVATTHTDWVITATFFLLLWRPIIKMEGLDSIARHSIDSVTTIDLMHARVRH